MLLKAEEVKTVIRNRRNFDNSVTSGNVENQRVNDIFFCCCSGLGNFMAVSRKFQLSLLDAYDKIEKRDQLKKKLFSF